MVAYRIGQVQPPDEKLDTRKYVVYMGNEVIQGTSYNAVSKLLGSYASENAYETIHIGNNITSYYGIFSSCYNFNLPVNTTKVTNLAEAFYSCYNFNQPVYISNSVNSLYRTFASCSNFNQPVRLNSGNITNLANAFSRCYRFNQPINIQGNNINCYRTFQGCKNLNQDIYISGANDASYIFDSCDRLNSHVHIKFTENNGYITYGFARSYYANPKVTIEGNCTYMTWLFENCTNFNSPVTFHTNVTTTIYGMFNNCRKFNQPVNFPMAKGEESQSHHTLNMSVSTMFMNCWEFNQPVNLNTDYSKANKNRIVFYNNFFANCNKFNQPVLDPYNVNTVILYPSENVGSMERMFYGCSNYNHSFWSPNSKVDYSCAYIFYNCRNLRSYYMWFEENVSNLAYAFARCNNFRGEVSIYRKQGPLNITGMFYNISPSPNRYMTTVVFSYNYNNIFNKTDNTSIIGAPITWDNIWETSDSYKYSNNLYDLYMYARKQW